MQRHTQRYGSYMIQNPVELMINYHNNLSPNITGQWQVKQRPRKTQEMNKWWGRRQSAQTGSQFVRRYPLKISQLKLSLTRCSHNKNEAVLFCWLLAIPALGSVVSLFNWTWHPEMKLNLFSRRKSLPLCPLNCLQKKRKQCKYLNIRK